MLPAPKHNHKQFNKAVQTLYSLQADTALQAWTFWRKTNDGDINQQLFLIVLIENVIQAALLCLENV